MQKHTPEHELRRLDLIEAGTELYVAGGNMGGDCDQRGRPVEDGKLYLAHEGRTVAGPFDTEREAMEWLDSANAFDRANRSGWPDNA